MAISRLFRLFEARGHGGPTVTLHLPQQLAEDLLHVLHEAMEVAGTELPDGEDELELGDDEAELAGDAGELDFEPEDDLLPAGALGDDEEDDSGSEDDGSDEDDEDDDEEEEDEEQEEGAYQDAGASQKGLDDKQLEGSLSRAYGLKEKHIGFKKLAGQLAHKGGVRDPKGLAAAIGRKKYGAAGMAKKSAAGRKR